MQDVLSLTYFWLKAGHIIFVIFWMAGLFMLPRLFVYHQECEPDSPENARWIEREVTERAVKAMFDAGRPYRGVLYPGMMRTDAGWRVVEFNSRFGDLKGTNPEELLAAAHAGCFSMALGFMLEKAGHVATRIDSRADVAMETGEAGPSATGVHLQVRASVPGISAEEFAAIADNAKANCVISRALGIPVTLDAALAG